MGATTYGLLRNLVQPHKPKDKTFDQIVTVLKEHCWWQRGSTSGIAIKKLTSQSCEWATCEFEAYLDSSLQGQFISEIRNEVCQRSLLLDIDLTFAKACQIALNMETADRNARQLRELGSETNGATSVHKVKLQGTRNCYRWNDKEHNANECHFKDTKCHNHGKVGHIRKACCAKTRANDTKSRDKGCQKKNTKYVTPEEDSDLEMFTVLTVTSGIVQGNIPQLMV